MWRGKVPSHRRVGLAVPFDFNHRSGERQGKPYPTSLFHEWSVVSGQ
jgi:hypothetical protein